MSAPDNVVFRPSANLRWILGLVGLASGIGAIRSALGALFGGGFPALILGGALLLAALLGYAVQARAIVAGPEGLVSIGAFRMRRIAWSEVLCLEQTRSSFVVGTLHGPVSAGWIERGKRERLMRLVLQHAKLTIATEGVRFGLTARFVPRQRPIGFVRPAPADKLAQGKP